jgi:hypothetical protein
MEEMHGEKQAAEGSLGSPEKRTRTKDDDDWDMALNTYDGLLTRRQVRRMKPREVPILNPFVIFAASCEILFSPCV